MSDLALIKNLDGYPACFVRFEGAGNFVVSANGQIRTVSRNFWVTLPVYQEGALAMSLQGRLS
jgi:hypothetical protein